MRCLLAGCLIAASLAVAAGDAASQSGPRDTANATDLSAALETAARTVAPAVVEIFATSYAPGDVVLALDGKPMDNGRQLQVNLYRRFVGDAVSLDVLRDAPAFRT